MGRIAKLLGLALLLLSIGLLTGYLLARRRTVECTETLHRAQSQAASAAAALAEQKTQCRQLNEKRQSSRSLIEARARLLQALLEVHGKNFGLASQHIQTAQKLAEEAHAAWPDKAAREPLGQLEKRLARLHERTMLLDARVIEEIKGLVGDLQVFVDSNPS